MLILEGERCIIHVLSSSEQSRELHNNLWSLSEQDGDTGKVLWSFENYDLNQFSEYFSDPHNLLFVVYTKEYTDCVGFAWFNEIMPNFKAHTAIFIRKKYRKLATDEVSKLSIDFMFKHFNLKELWSHTPYLNAHKLSLRLGSTEMAILPNYLLIKGVSHDYHISRLLRS